jgi:hypothetical protein
MTLVHLTNGDAAADRLRAAGLEGRVIVSADVLHEGPLIDDGDEDAYRRRRAAFLARVGLDTEDGAFATLSRWDADVDAAQEADEVVLWFEPDLFDQLVLVRLLAQVASQRWRPRRLSVVCRESHPRLGNLSALGTLSAAAARVLFAERVPVSDGATTLAARAWQALCAPRPVPLAQMASVESGALPFLPQALQRLLAEYPDIRDGTSLTEHRILQAVESSPLQGIRLFRAVQRMEPRAFMGDMTLFARLRTMATARHPLISVPGADHLASWRHATVSITQAGATVLRGAVDAVALNGLDRWIGGVHLHGDRPRWRWVRSAGQLIEPS